MGIGPSRASSRRSDFLSVAKPFSYAELLARVRAVLRRASVRSQRGALRVGDLTLDPVTRAVRLGGEPIDLSAKEFALLHQLAEDPERVYTKRELLRDVWGGCSACIETGAAVTPTGRVAIRPGLAGGAQ